MEGKKNDKEFGSDLKRPKSSFFYYYLAKRSDIKVRRNERASKILGRKWRNLDFDAKKPYIEKSNAEWERYRREKSLPNSSVRSENLCKFQASPSNPEEVTGEYTESKISVEERSEYRIDEEKEELEIIEKVGKNVEMMNTKRPAGNEENCQLKTKKLKIEEEEAENEISEREETSNNDLFHPLTFVDEENDVAITQEGPREFTENEDVSITQEGPRELTENEELRFPLNYGRFPFRESGEKVEGTKG
ncbi:high mobility group B protein 6-like [Centruroides sculpturatus]|uniref:high mobility group B protein 6-like n=1 Tax=Centruroides sculpturatus TaxID=218467 RepID=UPI000C6E50AD|nr:high mobility group B protein 6-like [Centruroides sculpturatus]